MKRFALLSAFAVLSSSACSGSVPLPAGFTPVVARAGVAARIQHIVIVVQDQRSFDNVFAGFPGADAPTYGLLRTGARTPLRVTTLHPGAGCAIAAGAQSFLTAYDDGKMDGFDRLDRKQPLCPYTRIARSETKPYWSLAKRYTIADRTFASTYWGGFVNRQYLVAGTTRVGRDEYDIGLPTALPLGCDAPAGARTTVVTRKGILTNRGPFPCFTYPTMAQRLDAKSISWRYYVDENQGESFNAYGAVKYVREGPDWKSDVISPTTRVLSDLKGGTLAQVSWVVGSDDPAWVESVANAARKSRYWSHLAMIVLWASDGNENFYDNVPPPNYGRLLGLGLRVPMIVISPYAKRGFISHTVYETGGSTLRFIEETFGLRSLGASDVYANSIGDCFQRR